MMKSLRFILPLALFIVNINPESRVKVARGQQHRQRHEQGQRQQKLQTLHEAAPITAVAGVVSAGAATRSRAR